MLYIIAGAILFFLITFLAFKIIKNTVKVMFLIVGLLTLIVISGSVLVYLDAKDLKESLLTSNGELLIVKDNILAGFEFSLSNFSINLYDSKKISELSKLYPASLKAIKGNNYKLIIMSVKALNNTLPDTIKVNEKQTISKKLAFEILYSGDPINLYLDSIVDNIININDTKADEIKNTIRDNLGVKDNFEFKALFSSVIFRNMIENEPEKIVIEYKKGNIIIYPETILLKMFKMLPDSYIKQKFENLKVYLKEKLKDKLSENFAGIINTTG